MALPALTQSFVLHFGEMGSRWGFNRTVGQIYALLFLSPDPLNADHLVDQLGFSRSNVSMGLKELQGWNLVRLVHKPNDRRDHFATPDDLWTILRTLVEERKKREVDPTLSVLRELIMQTPEGGAENHARHRMGEMLQMMEELTAWYDEIKRLENARLKKLLSLGSRIAKVLEMKDRVIGKKPHIVPPPAAAANEG
jgi:DNA-binding transcriptional regulator GbsR (MarR family)